MKYADRADYIADWRKKNIVRINLRLNTNTEADILRHLKETVNDPPTVYIKRLVREDMARNSTSGPAGTEKE